MPDADDMDLLREFARHNSETAFAELVQHHINLVYSVALRHTANPGDAQDVTQAVFIILARKAARLNERTVLTGWLYETTRLGQNNFCRRRGEGGGGRNYHFNLGERNFENFGGGEAENYLGIWCGCLADRERCWRLHGKQGRECHD
jgi:hypothetical protein